MTKKDRTGRTGKGTWKEEEAVQGKRKLMIIER